MRRKSLLFVTYQNRQSEEGLTYAIGLAKTLGKGLSILMVRENEGQAEGFSDAAADAVPSTAGEGNPDREIAGRVEYLEEKCTSSGVKADVKMSELDAATAIKGSLSGDDGIEMILLGPNVTESENFTARRLARLIKTATMPIVTIARQACTA